jgi:hypothetical protein
VSTTIGIDDAYAWLILHILTKAKGEEEGGAGSTIKSASKARFKGYSLGIIFCDHYWDNRSSYFWAVLSDTQHCNGVVEGIASCKKSNAESM